MKEDMMRTLARLPDLESRVWLITKDDCRPLACDVLGYYLTTKGCYVRLYPLAQPHCWVGNRSCFYKVALSSFGKSWFVSLAEAETEAKRRNKCGKDNI